MNLTTAQQLAVAVLQGDQAAVAGLLDCLLEDRQKGTLILPVQRIVVPVDQVRVLFYSKDNAEWSGTSIADLTRDLRSWLKGERQTLGLRGIDRVELYQLPPKEPGFKMTGPVKISMDGKELGMGQWRNDPRD